MRHQKNHHRSRRIIRPTTHRAVGRFHSAKSNRTIHWESQLELDYMHLLEIDPGVVQFMEQPMPIHLEWDGRTKKYTPDLMVEHNHGSTIIEVKPADFSAKPEWQRLFKRAAAIYASKGIGFEVRTDEEIRGGHRLANARYLNRYRRHVITPEQSDRILTIAKRENCIFGELVLWAGGEFGYQDVCSLIAIGRLTVDLDETFSDKTEVFLASGREHWRA